VHASLAGRVRQGCRVGGPHSPIRLPARLKQGCVANAITGRHGEWTAASGAGPPAGPRWGVSMLPPGMSADDPRAREIMRRQQLR
jgi:hypothetical protein